MSSAVSFELSAEIRTDTGKGSSRRLRRLADRVPAIVYGGKGEPVCLSLAHNHVMKALENESFYSHILTLDIDGKKEKVVLKAIERHTHKPRIQHMDFQRVDASAAITMNVPVHVIGEETAPGIKASGILSRHATDLEVRCLPKDLPEFINVDISALNIEESIHISEIELPKGVESVALAHGNDAAIVAIHKAKRAAAEEDTPEEPAAEASSKSPTPAEK